MSKPSRRLSFFILFMTFVLIPFLDSISLAQMIGRPQTPSNLGPDNAETMLNFLSKFAERITTEELNLKRVSCQEQVRVEQASAPGSALPHGPFEFLMSGESKQSGQFSNDIFFVETHTPQDGKGVPEGMLVKDSFSAASEFLGMSHREVYSQQFAGKETMGGHDAFVATFQTMPKLESRKITIDGKPMPMRLSGKVWMDALGGVLLKLEVRQTKLPKGTREFSYNIAYAPPSAAASGYTLPASVHFTRTLHEGTTVTTQTFSNCRVN